MHPKWFWPHRDLELNLFRQELVYSFISLLIVSCHWDLLLSIWYCCLLYHSITPFSSWHPGHYVFWYFTWDSFLHAQLKCKSLLLFNYCPQVISISPCPQRAKPSTSLALTASACLLVKTKGHRDHPHTRYSSGIHQVYPPLLLLRFCNFKPQSQIQYLELL